MTAGSRPGRRRPAPTRSAEPPAQLHVGIRGPRSARPRSAPPALPHTHRRPRPRPSSFAPPARPPARAHVVKFRAGVARRPPTQMPRSPAGRGAARPDNLAGRRPGPMSPRNPSCPPAAGAAPVIEPRLGNLAGLFHVMFMSVAETFRVGPLARLAPARFIRPRSPRSPPARPAASCGV